MYIFKKMSPLIFFRVPLSQEHKNLLRQKKHPVGCFFFVTAIVFSYGISHFTNLSLASNQK